MSKINHIYLIALSLLTINSQALSSSSIVDDSESVISHSANEQPTKVSFTDSEWSENDSLVDLRENARQTDSELSENDSLVDLEENARRSVQNRAANVCEKLFKKYMLSKEKCNIIGRTKNKISRFFSRRLYYYVIFTEKNTVHKEANKAKTLSALSKENREKNKMATRFIHLYFDSLEGRCSEELWEKEVSKIKKVLGDDGLKDIMEGIEISDT